MTHATPTTAHARAVLYATALLAAWVIGPAGPVYWDSFGYVTQALTGQIGGLALGRPLFVLSSHALARAVLWAGLSPGALEPVLRAFWLAVSALSAPLAHALAIACGLGPLAALYAGLATALSPALAHTSRAVLTDAPALALTLGAFVLGARAVTAVRTAGTGSVSEASRSRRAFAAGALLGAAFGLREQAVVQGATLALMASLAPRGVRARTALTMAAGGLLTAAAPMAYVFATQREYLHLIAGWVRAMRLERATHPYGVRDALAAVGWLVALGPFALPLAGRTWVRDRKELFARTTLLCAVCVPALAQLALFMRYQDIAYSPRYLLPALPGAIALPAATALSRWTGRDPRRIALAVGLLALPLLIAAPLVRTRERPLRVALEAMPARLASVPDDAVVVTGQTCPAVGMLDRLARAAQPPGAPGPRREAVCPGWAWPADLPARLDAARLAGRIVVLDLRPGVWRGPQLGPRAEVEQYLRTRAGAAGVVVWR